MVDVITWDPWHTSTNHDKQLHTVLTYVDRDHKIQPTEICIQELTNEWSRSITQIN